MERTTIVTEGAERQVEPTTGAQFQTPQIRPAARPTSYHVTLAAISSRTRSASATSYLRAICHTLMLK